MFAFYIVGEVRENKTSLHARRYAALYSYSSCHHNVQCSSFKLFFFVFVVVVVCIVLFFLFFFLQRAARNCSKVRAACAVQPLVLARPNKFLIIAVVIADPAVDANYKFLSYLPHQSMHVNYRYPLCNFIV